MFNIIFTVIFKYHLFGSNEKNVIFHRIEDQSIYDGSKHPFLYQAKFLKAEAEYILPWKDAHKLTELIAEEIDYSKIILQFSTTIKIFSHIAEPQNNI